MKVIIDIPEVDYECAKQRWMRGNDAHKMDYYVSKGIPLDEVKEEIEQDMSFDMFDDYGNKTRIHKELWEILDNIGKAESEDKE